MSLAPVRRIVTAAAASALAITLAACSPVLTHKPYGASDGMRISWGENLPIRGENVLLLASEQGAPARLVGGLTNDTAQDAEITLGFLEGTPVTIIVPAHDTVLLDGALGPDVILADVPAAPGSTVAMGFATPSQGAVEFQVPVLDGTLDEYATLVPELTETITVGVVSG